MGKDGWFTFYFRLGKRGQIKFWNGSFFLISWTGFPDLSTIFLEGKVCILSLK